MSSHSQQLIVPQKPNNVNKESKNYSLHAHSLPISSVKIKNDKIVTISHDKSLNLWQITKTKNSILNVENIYKRVFKFPLTDVCFTGSEENEGEDDGLFVVSTKFGYLLKWSDDLIERKFEFKEVANCCDYKSGYWCVGADYNLYISTPNSDDVTEIDSDPIVSVKIHENLKHVYVGGLLETSCYDLASNSFLFKLPYGGSLCVKENYLAINSSGILRVFKNGNDYYTFYGQPLGLNTVTQCCFDSRGLYVITGGDALNVYSLEECKIKYKLFGHKGTVLCCDVDGDFVVSGGNDGVVYVGVVDLEASGIYYDEDDQ